MTCVPIVIFVYNRPWHTQQTLEALNKNPLASSSVLYVYADGAKENADENALQQIAETRNIAKSRKWCKEVIVIERERNYGLADSVISGVSEVLNSHSKLIVLEDDIITSPGFLTFMNDALNLYENEKKVWHVSAYWYPARGSKKLSETFFYNAATCWGWGTWKRAWANMITDPNLINQKILNIPEGIYHFNVEDGYDYYNQLLENLNGKIKTWAVKWYGSIFINSAMSLHPNHSLTNNIGHDGTGINCHTSTIYTWKNVAKSIEVKRIPLEESALSRKLIQSFFRLHFSEKRNYSAKIISRIKTTLKRKTNSFLVNKGYKIVPLTQKALEPLLKTERYKQMTVPLLGKEFLVADGKSFYYSYKEIFEDGIYKFNTENKTPLIIDCGCNYGTSILYFKSLFPQANIVGFEADPYIFNILQTNVAHYNLSQITLHNQALWNEETSLNFFSEKADGGRIELNNNSSDEKLITVKTAVLSKVIKDASVDLLKIDIEGAEIKVLTECEQYLKNVSKIFVEYHSFSNKEQQLDALLSILSKNGFRYQIHTIFTSAKPFVEKALNAGIDMQLNIFAFRD